MIFKLLWISYLVYTILTVRFPLLRVMGSVYTVRTRIHCLYCVSHVCCSYSWFKCIVYTVLTRVSYLQCYDTFSLFTQLWLLYLVNTCDVCALFTLFTQLEHVCLVLKFKHEIHSITLGISVRICSWTYMYVKVVLTRFCTALVCSFYKLLWLVFSLLWIVCPFFTLMWYMVLFKLLWILLFLL